MYCNSDVRIGLYRWSTEQKEATIYDRIEEGVAVLSCSGDVECVGALPEYHEDRDLGDSEDDTTCKLNV